MSFRESFIKNKDLHGIRMPSKIKLPDKHNKDLFRIVGIIHGDGNMSFSRIHVTDQCLGYHKKVLQPLFKKLFNLKLNLYHDKNRNTYYSHIKNKVVYKFLTKELGIPIGAVRKNLNFVPGWIKSAKNDLVSSYIAGIFDAESYVSKRQAEISFCITSKAIHKFIKTFLERNKIKFSYRVRTRRKNTEYEIFMYGKENIKSFLSKVELRNPGKISKLKLLSLAH